MPDCLTRSFAPARFRHVYTIMASVVLAAGYFLMPLGPAALAGDAIQPSDAAEVAKAPEATENPNSEPSAPSREFSLSDVEALAAQLAASPYAPPAAIPEYLQSLSSAQWEALRYTLEMNELWAGNANASFALRFFLPGYILNHTAIFTLLDGDETKTLEFNPEQVDSPDKALLARVQQTAVGFSGFNLAFVNDKGDVEQSGLVSASHLHFTGRNAFFGPFARPLVLDVAAATGEQVCHFREFWLRKPDAEDTSLTIYALMDSPAMTGAYELILSPGTSTVLDVRATVYSRRNSGKTVKIGLAPITGMFLFSETTGRRANDFRPEVHTCDGLLVADENSWQWTPLKNPQRLALGSFPLTNPKGFGLLQRDINFDHYQDLQNRYDRASSLWVEPKGDWGNGTVELVEIPGSREYHSNIIASWIPDADAFTAATDSAANGDNNGIKSLALAYRLYWMPPGSKLHDLGVARDTRMERSAEDNSVNLVVDFEGSSLNELAEDTGLTSVVELSKEATLVEKHLIKNSVTGGWRLTLKIAPPQGGVLDSLLTAREGPTQLSVSAYLKKGENLSEMLTETWRFNFIP